MTLTERCRQARGLTAPAARTHQEQSGKTVSRVSEEDNVPKSVEKIPPIPSSTPDPLKAVTIELRDLLRSMSGGARPWLKTIR